jgi:hypothetical protein
MLGETVISSTMTYRKYAAEPETEEETGDYYVGLALSFLLIFMFCLLFFNVQPEPEHHAFRRSRLAGVAVLTLNKWIGMAVLLVGVSIKLVIESVAKKEELSEFSNSLLTRAVGCSMLLLLLTRLCHYGGKIPRPTDPPQVQRLMWIWWALFCMASVAPFFLPNLSHPITCLSSVSGLLFVTCCVETWFSHVLGDHLPREGKGEEHAPLTTSDAPGYESIHT